MSYKKNQKLKNKHTNETFIIDDIYVRETPIGDTDFYILRSRKKNTPDEHLTKWLLDTYFELVE